VRKDEVLCGPKTKRQPNVSHMLLMMSPFLPPVASAHVCTRVDEHERCAQDMQQAAGSRQQGEQGALGKDLFMKHPNTGIGVKTNARYTTPSLIAAQPLPPQRNANPHI